LHLLLHMTLRSGNIAGMAGLSAAHPDTAMSPLPAPSGSVAPAPGFPAELWPQSGDAGDDAWVASLTLTPAPESARAGRAFARQALAERHLDVLAGDVELVVSELVTNALRHGGASPGTLELMVWRRMGHLILAVTDSSPRPPTLADADPLNDSGRGLRVVEEIAGSWGWTSLGDRRKAVWAVIGLATRIPAEPPVPGLGVDRPHVPRMMNYLLGGSGHFQADRAAADRLNALDPRLGHRAREHQAFTERAVAWLAGQGFGQFVDFSGALPAEPESSVHQLARQRPWGPRVAYVAADPVVLAYYRARARRETGICVIRGDIRRPGEVLADAALLRLIDMSQPVAVLLPGVLHFVTDHERPALIMAELRLGLASGSCLVVSHLTAAGPDGTRADPARAQVYAEAGVTLTVRDRDQVAGLLAGLDLAEPGLVPPSQWRPGPHGAPSSAPGADACQVAVARVP
jgi:anti-sigma regulatory factor (Ser/Thr protein kinase)